jgi:hypothetical protein
MDIKKNIGIWMDHSSANFIDINKQSNNCTINSNFTDVVREEAMNRSEKLMHNKEQQMHEAYYKEISDGIKSYDRVLLFGPTKAKTELHNFLKLDVHFKDKKIVVESADNMTDNEKQAFVLEFFGK